MSEGFEIVDDLAEAPVHPLFEYPLVRFDLAGETTDVFPHFPQTRVDTSFHACNVTGFGVLTVCRRGADTGPGWFAARQPDRCKAGR